MNLKNEYAGFLLSGEHEHLPFSELNALLEIFNIKAENLKIFKNYAVFNGIISKENIQNIVKRGGYINEGHLILFECPFDEFNLEKSIEELYRISEITDFPISKNETFAVRVHKLDREKVAKSMEIERKMGSIIKSKTFSSVNLKNPEKTIKIVISDNLAYVSVVLEKRDVEYFQNNRPHLRAYFHPGCIMPKLARCMVNLSRINENDILLDPFCGTGGFLIEAGLIGCNVIGSDIDEQMVNGAILNLNTYDLSKKTISIKKWNAKNILDYLKSLNIEKIDAVVTDPPYGISTSKKGDILEIFEGIVEILKKGDYLVFAAPNKMKLNLELTEFYEMRVHKSLTRYIHVYKK
ncbi:DNA methyltransferase [Methanococcus vannielii]|uniref:DNA methyltransferase n=1 Tax=Methanococcus vannielii TaxID=2187 RepID=UPI00064F5C76|nr:THUMP domain-containing protein [Methanococcus vannielii]